MCCKVTFLLVRYWGGGKFCEQIMWYGKDALKSYFTLSLVILNDWKYFA